MLRTLGIVIAALLVPLLSGCESDTVCSANCDVGNTRDPNKATVDGGEKASSDNVATTSNTDPEGDSGAAPSSASPKADAAAGLADAGTGNTEAADRTDASALKVDAGATAPTEAGRDPGEPDAEPAQTTNDGGTTSSAPGAARGIECERVCAAVAIKGCGDIDTCEPSMCSILDVEPECAPEAKVYMSCMAAGDPESDFECRDDGLTQYISERCNDPYYNTWLGCLDRIQGQR